MLRSRLPFDLSSLEIFLAVCETGTMAAAARRLHLTQPAISQSIQEIEGKIGVQIFDRTVRPLGLTPAGMLLHQRASSLLADARQIAPLLRDAKKGKLASLRIGMVDSLSSTLAADLAASFLSQVMHVSILSGLTKSHATLLFGRQVDIIIGIDELEDIDRLERWPVIQEPYLLIAPAEQRAIKSLAELKDLARTKPLIRFSARSKTGADIERHLRRLGLDIERNTEFDMPSGVTSLVASGHGWAVTTPLCLIEAHPNWKKLHCMPLPGPQLSRQLTLVARAKELGDLPKKAAETARRIIQQNCAATISRYLPWIRDAFHAGHTQP